jgi:uncharacterized protein (TIGR02646 family)
MKCISKSPEPESFVQWKIDNAHLKMPYGDLHGDKKKCLKLSLIEEQGGLCCYCEREIGQDDSHVEHFRPQRGKNAHPHLDLEYQNLLCSCQVPHLPIPTDPRHCGVLKDQWFDDVLLISPLDTGCESRFRFAEDGSIYPANDHDDAAMVTIEKLGLDIDKLRSLREGALKGLEDLPRGKVQRLLGHPQDGRFQEFFTTIQQLLT